MATFYSAHQLVVAMPTLVPAQSFEIAVLHIQINVSPLLLVAYRQFIVDYIPHVLQNSQHMSLFAIGQLRGVSIPAKLQYCILRLQFSFERISAPISDMTTF